MRGDDPDRRRRSKVSREEREELTPPAGADEAGRAVFGVHAFLLWPRKPGWSADMRRVVRHGLGMVSPLGCGVEPTLERILNSESGRQKDRYVDVSDLTSRIACVIPRGDAATAPSTPTVDGAKDQAQGRRLHHFR